MNKILSFSITKISQRFAQQKRIFFLWKDYLIAVAKEV